MASKLSCLVLILSFSFSSSWATTMTKACVFSEVKGQLFYLGLPLANTKVVREYEYENLEREETTTDASGFFSFPAVYQRSLSSLIPREFVVAQSLEVKQGEKTTKIWSNSKRSPEQNAELGGEPLQLSCEITDELMLHREFGSILRTNCRLGNTPERKHHYRFSDHFRSIDWMKHLPGGTLNDEVDLRYVSLSINKQSKGINIYLGPVNPDVGGSALSILLNEDLSLSDYEIEHLAPIPKN